MGRKQREDQRLREARKFAQDHTAELGLKFKSSSLNLVQCVSPTWILHFPLQVTVLFPVAPDTYRSTAVPHWLVTLSNHLKTNF